MRGRSFRIIATAMAGGLAITGVAIGANLNSGQAPKHAVLTANTSPVVILDNCPTLKEGYHGGCVDQLQAELNGIEGLSLSVDGTFGPATYSAVTAFQQQNGLQADGVVGPATKQALDNATSSVPTPSPGAPLPASAPASAPAAQPPSASVSATPGFAPGYVTNTIYFNQAQTDYFDSGESQACDLLSQLIAIPAVGEAAGILVAGCEVQWQIVELQAHRAEERGMCLKIKFTPPPALVWWPDIYSGKYCD